ncbi:MAG: Xaa-Pro peptidase family protein [Pseudomonadota bacterium]
MTPPPRGFAEAEFRSRVTRIQAKMQSSGLDAILVTTEPEVRYVTGFLTRFWESPSRPWFVIVPASGDPVAVIPSIGAHLMGQTWLNDIRTWPSPHPTDDGIGLVSDTLAEFTPPKGRIGVPSGAETHLRMPLKAWAELQSRLGARVFAADDDILRDARMVKSPAEIAKSRQACAIANRAFDRVSQIAAEGVPLDQVFRHFQTLCLAEGADWVGYLAGAAGQGGYGDVISPATDTPLAVGDVLMLDTGCVWDGYFCDFDRNFSVGPPMTEVATAHSKLLEATAAAFEAAKPGATAAELWAAIEAVVRGGPDAGRFGHGLGMQLTEGLSILPHDHTILREGMVLTLEPSVEVSPGRLMVHEENIVITATGAEYLSDPATGDLPVLECRP